MYLMHAFIRVFFFHFQIVNIENLICILYNIVGAVMSNKSSESEVVNVKSGSQAAGSAAGGQREGQNETLTAEELRKRRQAYFDR